MKRKARTWNYCWPDDPQPGLLHLEPPALSGEATFWIQCGGGTSEEQNKIAHRIAALWNMAERLGLSTEEIESGNVETTLKAAPYMLEALEWLSNEFDCRDYEYGMVGFTHDEFRKVEAAIRKARGGESPMTRETKAVGLLHRVLDYFLGGIAFPEKMERLLGEIEAFLTEIEAEERDALRK